jgi:hypothetical protein
VPSPELNPARRRGDQHALEVQRRLCELEERVDDLLLVARVVAIMVGANGVLNVLDALA